MISERAQQFFRNEQTIFWGVCMLLFAIYVAVAPEIPFFFHRTLRVTGETLPGIVLTFALVVTSVWSYFFLLWSVIEDKIFKDRPLQRLLFQMLFIGSIFLSAILVFLYLKAITEPPGSGTDVISDVFEDAGGKMAKFLQEFHLIFFVGIYAALDLLVAITSRDTRLTRRFADILVFVDTPILVSMAFVEFIVRPRIGLSFYSFEAGVIAFQLIAGSLSVIGLEILEGEIDKKHDASSGGSTEVQQSKAIGNKGTVVNAGTVVNQGSVQPQA